jgi:hypothetical protein
MAGVEECKDEYRVKGDTIIILAFTSVIRPFRTHFHRADHVYAYNLLFHLLSSAPLAPLPPLLLLLSNTKALLAPI